MKQRGLFDENDRLREISKLGDPLEKLEQVIEWESFRRPLEKALTKDAKGPGGRPPFDYIMMLKILVLQRLYGISDAQTEYQIKDRLSFMRFLGLRLCDTIPDEKTIWHFREQLVKANVIDTLFYRFTMMLEGEGLITRTGSIVDASFVDAPKQRNNREENETIKKGEVPEEWTQAEKKNKLAQKDVDARWAKKNDEIHYGYKNHVKADAESKLIINYEVTSAEVHDSQVLEDLVETDKDHVLYADSAYKGENVEACLGDEIDNQICEKGYRNKPLSEEQKANNRNKSSVRVRVEHIFGFMTNTMKGMYIRYIGIARARFAVGMMNLVYNVSRYRFLMTARG